jgi:GNAT superfamily N-acetyltransferase
VARLIERTFGHERDWEGRQAAREFRMLRYLAPLVWLGESLAPGWTGLPSGYVWEDEGRVVGTATITPVPGRRGLWILANVAVYPEYRRRGIGRALVEACVALARSRGAKAINLEVDRSNLPAQRIYRSLGFETVEGVVDLVLERVEEVTSPPVPTGFHWHEIGQGERERRSQLRRAAYPPARERMRQLRMPRAAPERVLLGRLGDILWGPAVRRWALEAERGLAATLTISGLRGRRRRLELVVHPDRRGAVEDFLVGQALQHLASYPPGEVATTAFSSHTQALQALRGYGFREVRVMEQLELRFGR